MAGQGVAEFVARRAQGPSQACQERRVLRERDGIHLFKVTRRLPLRLARCEAGAFDGVIVAATKDRAAVLHEGNGGDSNEHSRPTIVPTRPSEGMPATASFSIPEHLERIYGRARSGSSKKIT